MVVFLLYFGEVDNIFVYFDVDISRDCDCIVIYVVVIIV